MSTQQQYHHRPERSNNTHTAMTTIEMGSSSNSNVPLSSSRITRRISSHTLLELEEQQQQQNLYNDSRYEPEQRPRRATTTTTHTNEDDHDYDNDDEVRNGQNHNTSSSSDDDDDFDVLSVSDTDDSCLLLGNGVCTGDVVEDAILAIQAAAVAATSSSSLLHDDDQTKNRYDIPSLYNNNQNDTDDEDDDDVIYRNHYPYDQNNTISRLVSDTTTDHNIERNDDYSPKKKHHKRSMISRRLQKWKRNMKTRNATNTTTPFDVEQYMMKREMSKTQEKWNAITVVPNPLYCLYFLLSAQWLTQTTTITNAFDYTTNMERNVDHHHYYNHNDWTYGGCFQNNGSSWHSMPALPPLPVIAVALGICLHAPWSFLYHWTYAHTMSAKYRTKHWSRRMDQSMIHIASALLSYGSSGSIHYFIANLVYNIDCVRRQFRPIVRPKQNQMRIFISIIAYTIPLLKRGEYSTFIHLWIIFMISGYFFIQYPVGGWSHSVFHIIIAFAPPLLMQTATQLPASIPQLYKAASCMHAM